MNKHFHPEIYQKSHLFKNYFEGWYYKQVTKDGKHTISFIPGVSFNNDGSHAFIQCLHLDDKGNLNAYNIEYPIETFVSTNSPFSVFIEKNTFSLEKITLDIDKDLKVKGSIELNNITPIQSSLICPNIMGFFSYIPYMECNHGVLSMTHSLTGGIEVNGDYIDFTGGKGYLEKDWGRSFPKQYVWIQSNHFNDPSASIFFSMANIPFLGLSFNGFICNLVFQGQEYRFATYTGAKLKVKNFTDSKVSIEIISRKYTLRIEGTANHSEDLLAPKSGKMDKTIKEMLAGEIEVTLMDSTGKVLFSQISSQCGMELVLELINR